MIDPLDLDTLDPCNDMLFVDRKCDAFIQHGGCATRVVFEEVEEMPLSALKEELATPVDQDQLMVVRSVAGQYMLLLRGDRVIRYKGCQFQDCCLDDMTQILAKQGTGFVYSPLSKYPLMHVNATDDCRTITVRIPRRKVLFKGDRELGNIEDEVYLPNLWFATKMTNQITILDARVAIEGNMSVNPADCTLKQLCFPNTYTNGSICFGWTRTETRHDTMNESMLVASTIDRLFNSLWNDHVLWDHRAFLEKCEPIYDQLPKLDLYEDAISDCGNRGNASMFLKYLRILHEPDGYMRVQNPPIDQSAVLDKFLPGVSR